MPYEIGRTEPLDEWEWDGVLVSLDFTPELHCDVCVGDEHPAVYHLQFSCNCHYFACQETALLLPFMFLRFRPTCQRCGRYTVWVTQGRPL